MLRKDRSDIRIKKLAEKHGIPESAIRTGSGRKMRKDKKLGTVRKEQAK